MHFCEEVQKNNLAFFRNYLAVLRTILGHLAE